ncbi:sigma-70 family RNA polymerase sigma factor [Paenibacillus athensensis]|uniref:RNA polymerase subunit sigma-70 n=1 Tax=Paenibacillus athensensis TaxID=1967502 RepID=A0A4Y8Q6I9_9BACL|nr:sigma-70 family RNA polymerase sigma factor [Paenibacillus athensensis]MCD1259715.1 sigma-70 family RNA polymerase sigma factor [Paenibacillus athensensis]
MSKYLMHLFISDFYTLDKGIQEHVYQEFYILVYPMIYFILRDHAGVEDIIQEAFLRAVRKAPMLKERDKYESWLKKLTRNVTLNHLRKHKRNRDELDAEMIFVMKEAAPASDYLVPLEKEVELKLMREAIVKYINQLSPSYRQIIAMKWIHNLSYKDMAAELGVTEGVVRQRLYRAREAVRQKLMEEWGVAHE